MDDKLTFGALPANSRYYNTDSVVASEQPVTPAPVTPVTPETVPAAPVPVTPETVPVTPTTPVPQTPAPVTPVTPAPEFEPVTSPSSVHLGETKPSTPTESTPNIEGIIQFFKNNPAEANRFLQEVRQVVDGNKTT